MKFCQELKTLFSEEELIYITKEAVLVYEDDNGEIDYLLWLRKDGLHAEFRLDYEPEIFKILRLDDSEYEYYEKDKFLEMLRNSTSSELKYLEVE